MNATSATTPDPLDRIYTEASDERAPPPALLPYQRRWIEDQASLKIAEKSRRVGLTWAEAADDVLFAAAEVGSNTFYISANQDMAVEYIEACAMWARAFDIAAGQLEEGVFLDAGDKEIKTYKIEFPRTRRRIVALSSRPANLRGKQGRVVIDEAAFAPDLEGLLKAALAMLLWGDQVRVISTHNGDKSPFAELIDEIRGGRRKGSVHRITLADAVAEGLYQRVCLRRHVTWTQAAQDQWVSDAYAFYGDDASEELDVVPSQSAGAYFPLALIEARMSASTPVVRKAWLNSFALLSDAERERIIREWCVQTLLPAIETLSPHRPHAVGLDFARSAHLTVITVLEEQSDLKTPVCLVVELRNCPFTSQEQILNFVNERLPRFCGEALDATGNGAYLAERAKQRWGSQMVNAVTMNNTFYVNEFPRLKAALEDGTVTDIPRDAEIRDDLRAVQKVDGIPKIPADRAVKGEGNSPKERRHGDFAVSLLLAHVAMKHAAGAIDYTPLPSKSARWDGVNPDDRDDGDDPHDVFEVI